MYIHEQEFRVNLQLELVYNEYTAIVVCVSETQEILRDLDEKYCFSEIHNFPFNSCIFILSM